MRRLQLRNKLVMVTGASSGLGRELAVHLARDYGANLLLTARRQNLLMELSQSLELQFGIQTKIVVADLDQADGIEMLTRQLDEEQIDVAILCAGQTYFGPFLQMESLQADEIVRLNITAVVELCRHVVRGWTKSQMEGSIMIVGSMGGIIPLPYQAVYSGTKGFLHCFGLGLAYELRDAKVSITTVAPGGIDTEMLDKSDMRRRMGDSVFNQHVSRCAKQSLQALVRRKSFVVPGRQHRIGLFVLRLLPISWAVSVLGRAYAVAFPKPDHSSK